MRRGDIEKLFNNSTTIGIHDKAIYEMLQRHAPVRKINSLMWHIITWPKFFFGNMFVVRLVQPANIAYDILAVASYDYHLGTQSSSLFWWVFLSLSRNWLNMQNDMEISRNDSEVSEANANEMNHLYLLYVLFSWAWP